MAYDATGTVKLVQDPQTFSSGFSKREMVLTVDDGKFTQEICFEFHKDKMSLLDSVQEGQTVKVTFDIRGREYNGRYFNNLVAWKIESEGGTEAAAAPANADRPPIPDDSEAPAEFDDDIPF